MVKTILLDISYHYILYLYSYIMSSEEGASNLQERLQKLEKECAALRAKAGKRVLYSHSFILDDGMYKSLSEALEANLKPSASTEDGAKKVYSIRTPSEWDKISPESKDVLQKYLAKGTFEKMHGPEPRRWRARVSAEEFPLTIQLDLDEQHMILSRYLRHQKMNVSVTSDKELRSAERKRARQGADVEEENKEDKEDTLEDMMGKMDTNMDVGGAKKLKTRRKNRKLVRKTTKK
tara:strand:+ start:10255 stop:10959 length:705 start_codon:yes stop_codon:yes gene_type:complete